MMTNRIRSYCELIQIPTFFERFEYLKLNGAVGADTFGFDRIFNQMFYRSTEWKHCRDYVIARDLGRDLGIAGLEIRGRLIVHHMNPITLEDIENSNSNLFDPDQLITTCHATHYAIHYGDPSLIQPIVERSPNDTCPWRKQL